MIATKKEDLQNDNNFIAEHPNDDNNNAVYKKNGSESRFYIDFKKHLLSVSNTYEKKKRLTYI